MATSFHPLPLWILLLLLSAPGHPLAALPEEFLAAQVHPPLKLGDREPDMPVWRLLDGGGAPTGFLFETRDLAAIPGFAGTPINLLVAIDNVGDFLWVSVLGHNEPAFVSGLGPEPLHSFVTQYRDLSLAHNIAVSSPYTSPTRRTSTNAYIDGMTKATASVRIANESILSAALKVARAHLAGVAPRPVARPREDLYTPMDWEQLVSDGLIMPLHLTRNQVDQAFADSGFENGETTNLVAPEKAEYTLWVADLRIPTVARNLLDVQTLAEIETQFDVHEEPVLVMGRGRYSLLGRDFVRNAVPDHLLLNQGGHPVHIRDAAIVVRFRPDVPRPDEVLVLRVDTRIGFDPGSPWELGLRLVRQKGQFMPEVETRDFAIAYALPKDLLQASESVPSGPAWTASWRERQLDIGLLLLFLTLLSLALVRPVVAERIEETAATHTLRCTGLHTAVRWLVWSRPTQHPQPDRARQHAPRRRRLRLPPLRPLHADSLGLRPGHRAVLGTRSVLWLALPVRRNAGVRTRRGEAAWRARGSACLDISTAACCG